MSVFSRPMGQGRMGLYNWGGTAVGAGVGAAMAGKDHRTSGAVVGSTVGSVAGMGLSAYHAYGHNLADTVAGAKRAIPWARAGKTFRGSGGQVERTIQALKGAGSNLVANPNVTDEIRNKFGAIFGMMRRRG